MKKLWLGTVTLLLVFRLFLPMGIASDVPFANVPFDVTNIPEPVPPPQEVRDFFDLDPFYQQWINVEGYPVLASEKVSPYAVKETAWHIKRMIGHRSDILKALAQLRSRFLILAHNEVRSDLPEYRDVETPVRFFYDVRLRGGGGWATFGAEEQVFIRGGVNIHELAHVIHEFALNKLIDSTFDDRLRAIYNSAMQKGLWAATYAATNRDEYWAEGVTNWFHAAWGVQPIKTREDLKAYDPSLASLIAEVFGDNDWRYTPIRDRLHLPHLQGFDPESAPGVEFPPGVEEAYEELRDPAINERNEWINLRPYDPSLIPILNESRTRGDRTDILFVNLSGAEVLLYRVHPDGTETLDYRFPPNPRLITHFTIEVGGLLLAKDSAGLPFAVFQAVEKVGRALVAPELNLITPGLSKVSGDNQAGVSGSVLVNPFVVEVREESLSTLEGIPVTFTVTAGDGTLSATRTTTDRNGRAESTLTLGPNLGTNTVSVSAAGIEGTVTFNVVAEAAVNIPDTNLRAAVETVFGKAEDYPIAPSEMTTLTRLEARNANISDLTGLEFATNLTGLHLGDTRVEGEGWINSNSIKDLSPLEGLTNLTWLNLGQNNITDISPLAELTNLTWLDIGGNNLSNISPVSGLINLTALRLWRNNIKDISPVADLTHLTELNLDYNNITDISAVAGLTNLTRLRLRDNNISDISPLVANTGLGNGNEIYVRGNPLSYLSLHTHIPILRDRGVTVEFDNRIPTTLLKISGDDQKGVSGETLTHPFVVEVRDGNGDVFEGVPVAFDVTAGGGTLSVTSPTTDENGRAESTLTFGSDTGTNTVRVRGEGISESVTFNAIAKEVVNIPDPGLRAAIEATLDKASGAPITADEMATLTDLSAENANISDLTGLEGATYLTSLALGHNSISDLSVLGNLTHLTSLQLGNNGISELSSLVPVLARLTNLTALGLKGNGITDISALEDLTHLTSLNLDNNSIVDISVLEDLTDLTNLSLSNNSITDISALSDLTNLTELDLEFNSISDLSPLVANTGLKEGDTIDVGGNSLSYPSIHTHIPTLKERGVDVAFNDRTPTTLLKISGDDQKGISGETLTHPFVVEVRDGNDDAFEGVPVTFDVTAGGGTLSVASPTTDENGRAESAFTLGNNVGMNTVSVSAAEIQGIVTFNAVAEGLEFDLSVPMGTSLIHVPLKVTTVDSATKTITSIADLYDALGGADTVNYLVTLDPHTQKWHSYLAPLDKGTAADSTLTDDTGIIAGMKAPVSLRLSGIAWGTNGTSTITLNQGLNLVGIPLKDERINRVSDLLRLDGIWGNVPVITVSDGGKFKVVRQVGDPGDIAITGGGAFILNAQQPATVAISGEAWTNVSEAAAAPLITRKGIEVGDTTPVLVLRGSVADEEAGLKVDGFRVTVKNLSTGRAVTGMIRGEEAGYRLTVVDIETARSATIGDILEILAQSPSSLIGVQPLWYTVTAEDVRQSLIQLPALIAYEIPSETELLRNYPNPFNPETWIPYRLAEDAFVILTIYDGSGRVIRTLDVGHRIAAVYESRSKAIYWDGRNDLGEQVASGVYFYTLTAGDFSATRRVVIIK